METATQPPVAEKLNQEFVQLPNLASLKKRAVSLFKAIFRILQANTTPKWSIPKIDIVGQCLMVNLELFNIVEEVKNVSKAFLVAILPVMLSSKLLLGMETDDNSKREQLLQNLQIERLKARMDMIAAACENAEKVLADTRKAYEFGSRQGPSMLPTMDKRSSCKDSGAAVNDGADQLAASTA